MSKLSVRDLNPIFGVEILGLEPHTPLDPQTLAHLRALFDDKGVLVFRDIDIDIEFQTYLSEVLIGNDINPAELHLNEKFLISNKAPAAAAPRGRLLYHCDQMWSENDRVDIISLYGLEVGQPAAPTMFVSAEHAWNTLPGDLRESVEARCSVQHYTSETYAKRAKGDTDVLVSTFDNPEAQTIKSVGLAHPRTGRKVLYVCQQTTESIEGLTDKESDALLDALFDHMYANDKQYAHHWRERDLVIWDNVSIQHARPNVTVEGPARTLRKTLRPIPSSTVKSPNYGKIAATA